MMTEQKKQYIWVFQQHNSGMGKIQGIEKYGDAFELKIISIDDALPLVIDDTAPYIPDPEGADLVLDYLKHPDLSHALAEKCRAAHIPVIASGKKPPLEDALTPTTCCALKQQDGLGPYGLQFGLPEYRVSTDEGRITAVETLRGAPCGATWEAGQRIVGLTLEEAPVRIGLETQYSCVANPAGWDPITGKSPVHVAGDLHKAALLRALKKAGDDAKDPV